MKTDCIEKNESFNTTYIIENLPQYLEKEQKTDYDWDTNQDLEEPSGIYKQYEFYIDTNHTAHIEEKVIGIKPSIEARILNPEITLDNVEIEVTYSILEGNVSLQSPEGVTLKSEGSNENTKIFVVSQNGNYTFTAIGDSGRKARVTVSVVNIVEKPKIEITQIEDTSCMVTILNGIQDVTYSYYLNGVGNINHTTQTSVKIENLTKGTNYNVYVVLSYNKKTIQSDTKEFMTTNTTESMEEIVLTTNGFVNCYKKAPITNEVVGKILDKSIPYATLKKANWNKYYEALYNVFDGNIYTSGKMGAQTISDHKRNFGRLCES